MERFASLVDELSAAMAQVSADEIDKEIKEWLRRIVLALEVDRGTFWERVELITTVSLASLKLVTVDWYGGSQHCSPTEEHVACTAVGISAGDSPIASVPRHESDASTINGCPPI